MVDPHNIEGCEDLLESYFMQVSCHSQSYLAVQPAGLQGCLLELLVAYSTSYKCVSLASCRAAYLRCLQQVGNFSPAA